MTHNEEHEFVFFRVALMCAERPYMGMPALARCCACPLPRSALCFTDYCQNLNTCKYDFSLISLHKQQFCFVGVFWFKTARLVLKIYSCCIKRKEEESFVTHNHAHYFAVKLVLCLSHSCEAVGSRHTASWDGLQL